MSDSPLSCDFPETDIEQQLEKRRYRTYGQRLASPPALKVEGVSDSAEDMGHGVAHISGRFIDIRTAFLTLRIGLLPIINLFMVFVLFVVWIIEQFYTGVFAASAVLFFPLWAGFIIYEAFFPFTLPVRIDRKEGFVYVGHRGTFYRIPWSELEVTISYNLQYFGSGVMWDRQYYSHIFLRDKHYFCGKAPKSSLQRKRISSYFKEDHLYRKWNFIVRYYQEGPLEEDFVNLETCNYDSYMQGMHGKSVAASAADYLSLVLFMPTMIWARFSPFKFKWPKEIEAIFGKANYY